MPETNLKYNNILFVCTGNTCRSVMAEGILKKLLKEKSVNGIKVSSAGVAALPVYKIYKGLRNILAENGIDVSEHIAKRVNKEMLNLADLILVMEHGQKEVLLEMRPDVDGKVFLLKGFAEIDDEHSEISDPMGQPFEVYRKAFEDMYLCVNKVLDGIMED